MIRFGNCRRNDNKSIIYKGSRNYICKGYDEESDAVKKIIETAKENDKVYIKTILIALVK